MPDTDTAETIAALAAGAVSPDEQTPAAQAEPQAGTLLCPTGELRWFDGSTETSHVPHRLQQLWARVDGAPSAEWRDVPVVSA